MIFIKERNRKNAIILALLIVVGGMVIGYAALMQQLTINGTAEVTSTWDVKMTNITDGEASNSAGVESTAVSNSAEISGNTTATFDVSFQTPGDTMEYDITVTNNGSLDAKLSNVTATATDGSEGSLELTEENGINYEITIDGESIESAKNKTITNGGGTSTIHVKVYWDQAATEVPENTTKKLLVNLEYVQA